MWDDGEGHYLGHIRLETSKGRVFDSGRGTEWVPLAHWNKQDAG